MWDTRIELKNMAVTNIALPGTFFKSLVSLIKDILALIMGCKL